MKKYVVSIDAYVDGKVVEAAGIGVFAPSAEHAGIKACAEFINGHPTSYGVQVTSIKEME